MKYLKNRFYIEIEYFSGPRRFDYDFTTREWRCVRDHHIVLEPFFKQEVESLFE